VNPGDKLSEGRYELEGPLARGGMGEVWIGRDVRLDREIAVKFVRAPDGVEEHVRRFIRESRITARLQHPGIPAVYDGGVDNEGRPFLVMQRIHGITVADLIAEHGPLPVGWSVAIAAQVCAVLAAAHGASLIHRDLKPANLMLEPDGCVKVLDFGLATAPTLADFSRITLSKQAIGTPAYMAPEQVEANVSEPATDLYALGCTLHEMLTGDHVFDGATPYSVMSQQAEQAPPRVRAVRPDVPSSLERLILDLLRKRPEERPASAEEVFDRLIPFAEDLTSLVGVTDPTGKPSPIRMYADVVSKIALGPGEEVSPPAAEPHAGTDTRKDLVKAREEARRLVRESRFSQAADLLGDAEATARAELGSTDSEVFKIRSDLASALFEGGDYRRAERVFRALGADLEAGGRTPPDLLFDCRVKEAICQAMTGHAAPALDQLNALLADRRDTFGDDQRTLELRKQIAVLQLRSGRRGDARRTLTGLLADVRRLPGGTQPSPAEVADLLGGIRADDT
jgi:serine/threonine protein kinase